MAQVTKRKQVRIYLDEIDEERLNALVESVGKSATETFIVSTIVAAGLKACADAGNRIHLPLNFCVMDEEEPRTPSIRLRK